MIEYQMVIAVLVAAVALVATVNALFVPRMRSHGSIASPPLVSVLIPARNEGEALGDCLASIADQDYANVEILVLDDNSEDTTAAIARDWQSRSGGRIRLISGRPLAPGWVGKCFACHQLSEEAHGDLLLFTDADTRHARSSISSAIATLLRLEADLLTAIPRQETVTFWERMMLPLLHFVTFGFLPVPLVSRVKAPSLSMANGQFMLFRRTAYDSVGGHAAVRSAIVEDVWLARRMKSSGFTVSIVDGSSAVSCRMYRSLRDIWEGFSKNLFPGVSYSTVALAAVSAMLVATSVLPAFFLAAGLLAGHTSSAWVSVVQWQVGMLLWTRTILAMRFRNPPESILLHPAAVALLVAIAVNSWRWVARGGGSRWKGRRYDATIHHPIHNP